ncbi:MAG: YraN family protein [Desulfovibrionaceae bacterium]
MPARPVVPAGAGTAALGRAGEDAAAEHLRRAGLKILARNWRHGRLELDLVCRRGRMLVFVEVKTRGPGSRGAPAEALGRAQAARLARAAAAWLSEHDAWDTPCRFDLVTATPGPDGAGFTIDHRPGAFTLDELPDAADLWQPF